MKDLIRTNNPPLISFVESLLKEINIPYFVADQAMSSAEGSIGMFPKRILVPEAQFDRARQWLIDAGLESELRPLKSNGWD